MTHQKNFLLISILFFISPTVFSCDDTACEMAYLNSTQQYIGLQHNHAAAAQRERIAYAKIRENRQRNINEQWVREANSSLIYMINKAVLNGESMHSVKRKLDAAYASGKIKSKPTSVHVFKDQQAVEDIKSPVWAFFRRVLRLEN
jgi:hypothetical protein